MNELPITPFPPLTGLQPLGAADAGICIDGVCAVPEQDIDEPADQVSTDSPA